MTRNVDKLVPKVVHDIERISPALAAEYLMNAAVNRKVSDNVVSKYIHAMERGQWDLGQPLCFDEKGKLVDGQHRLHAVIRSGITQDFNVLRGINNAMHMDIGRARTASDMLTMLGYKSTTTLAAIARVVILMEERSDATPVIRGNTGAYITTDDIISRVDRDPLLTEVTAQVAGSHKPLASLIGSSAIAGWFLYCLALGLDDKEVANNFFANLYGEVPGEMDNPAIVLYKTLNSRRSDRRNLTKREKAAYLIKAWNNYIQNEPMTRMFFRSFGKKAEEFPKLMLDKPVAAAGN
jgi:hypothetical protein